MTLSIVYAQTPFPTKVVRTLFLAGPTDRSNRPTAWRQEALQILRDLDFDGHVFIPEAEDGKWNGKSEEQNEWEQLALLRADAIVFWVARDLENMPGFTTNIEWGQWMQSGKVVLGIPDGAPKTSYMEWCAEFFDVPCVGDLKYALRVAREHIIGSGALREGADVVLSLGLWKEKQKVVYPKPDLTADNVVVHKDSLLLIRRKKDPFKGRWALPGGYVNKGEETKAAAIRELEEEAGLKVSGAKLIGVFSKEGRDPRGWIVSHAYFSFADTREIQAGDDAAEAKWFTFDEVDTLELAFDHREIFQEAIELGYI
jgi:8-oxo-dGTP diphosphatase